MQAHSAPLGLAFYEGSMFPPEYRNNIFVAFHGSWNRSVPTGYKIIRVKLDDKGQPIGGAQDFITGWLAPGETKHGRWMGRPVGIAFGSDGSMYVSDDAGGVIYQSHLWQVITFISQSDTTRLFRSDLRCLGPISLTPGNTSRTVQR